MNSKSILSILTFLFFCVSCRQTNEQLLDEAYNLSRQKKYDKAIEVYTRVIKRNSKLQLAYYNRGFAYVAIKEYDKALGDFNRVMELQSHGNFIITYNQNSPLADEEARTQVPYDDALYQRVQVKYFMDSLKSAFIDFQLLVDRGYEEKSNCMLWQGTIYLRDGKTDKGCEYLHKAKRVAVTENDKSEANKMLQTYCDSATANH